MFLHLSLFILQDVFDCGIKTSIVKIMKLNQSPSPIIKCQTTCDNKQKGFWNFHFIATYMIGSNKHKKEVLLNKMHFPVL